ncbi:MAG: gluconate:H+ symporter [Bryobacterales bacterium]|nr:gluconate:H+ symporter [Bryobacterales bacterium]
MHPILILLIAVAAVFVLIIQLRVNAFVALISSAILIGLLSPDIGVNEVVPAVGERFGDVVGRIGIAIAMAAIVGQCLMESGAADRITRRFVAWLGEARSSLSLVASGYVLSVPVFSDTVFYLLVPLARAMSIRMGRRNYVLYVMAISAGGSATHVFVPPTPGPLVMASTLSVDVGIVILVGLCVALPASLCGWLYSIWIDRKLNIPIREAPGLSLDELGKIATRPEEELPGFWASMSPILLPVVLITSNTVANTFYEGTGLALLTAFLGNPSFALLAGAVVSLWLLARQNRLSLKQLAVPVEEAIKSAGVIILITAGGGAFGGMLVRAGVGDVLGESASELGMSLMLLGFLLAMLVKIAQGSGTVAMITASAIMAPLLTSADLTYHPVYVLMSIGSGALIGTWMNDSGFWVFRTMTGLTEIETLQTKTALLVVLGITGFAVTLLGSWLFPLV